MNILPNIRAFIDELMEFKSTKDVFNPWRDYHEEYDIGSGAPEIRRAHLESFLRLRSGKASYILVAEAVGYQGGRFSGISLVSERILTGHNEGIKSSMLVSSLTPRRTSNPNCIYMKHGTQKIHGFSEPTATIVWNTVLGSGIDPLQIATWNTFPFHPFKEKGGLFTNRTPREEEIEKGIGYLRKFISLFPNARVIAVGRIAEKTLNKCEIDNIHVPHPANGGANDFREAFIELCSR